MNKFALVMLLSFVAFSLHSRVYGQHSDDSQPEKVYKHSIEAFPIVALFKIYSVQYSYAFSPNYALIIGLAYVNAVIDDKDGNAIGQLFAPTVPIGIRRFFWKKLHLEYQLWPAYNRYYEKNEKKYYNGFDLYNEFRAGYKFDVRISGLPFFLNLQYVLGFGLYPGNKPDSFIERNKEVPIFHALSIGIGVRF